ncbi:hypothetical protein Ddye_007646, partial [Dipteronia dyeriana]
SNMFLERYDYATQFAYVICYPPGIKGYRLYDIESKQIFVLRDVIFHEHIFPFHNIEKFKVPIDPFPDIVLPLSVSSSVDSLPVLP